MYKASLIPITFICCALCSAAVARDIRSKLENPRFWEKKISESYATDIVNEIPGMVEDQGFERKQFEQSTDDAYLAKLKKRFFSFAKRNKIIQARIISKMMVKKGDYTGEKYLQSLN